MDDIEQLAKQLFEADEYTSTLYMYNKYGFTLKWDTAPGSIQFKYRQRARRAIADQKSGKNNGRSAA